MRGLTYREVLASREDPMPAGYRHLVVRAEIGRGRGAMALATGVLMSFGMHRRVGVRIRETSVVPGAIVMQSLWWVEAPIRIVWMERTARLSGFGIGTLAGHPLIGEESFTLRLRPDDGVEFEVRSFSRPAFGLTRAAGPLLPLVQRGFARRCGRALRQIVQNGQ